MERIKGMVLEINGRRAIILTPDGDFREVPLYRPDWEVGQTIEVPVPEPIALSNRRGQPTPRRAAQIFAPKRSFRWLAAVAAVAVILAAFLMFEPWAAVKPKLAYAAVAVDIHNDSFRLYVDADQHVVSAWAASEDGMRFLKNLDYQDQPLDMVVESLVREAVTRGKLQPHKTDQVVLMSASVIDETETDEQQTEITRLKKGLEEASVKGKAKLQARDVDAPLAVLTITVPILQKRASELELTVNEYLILLKARDMGVDLTVKDMVGKRFVARLRKQGLSLEQVLAGIQAEEDLTALSGALHKQLLYEQQQQKTVIEVPPVPPGAWADNGEQTVEDKVDHWLKKLHPPGLLKRYKKE